MKKKIFALFMAAAFLTSLTACNEHDLQLEGTSDLGAETNDCDTTAQPYGTLTMTADPNASFVMPEPVNGTYDAYGCTDLFHGDYYISGAVIVKDGKEIPRAELKKGDIIAVYYSGLMMESYPAQPDKVTKIEVVTCEPSEYVPQKVTGACKLFTVTCLADGNIHMNEYKEEFSFTAKVLEVSDGRILVDASGNGNGYYYTTNYKYWLVIGEKTTLCHGDEAISLDEIEAGDYIFAKYDGKVEELYPAILPNVFSVTLLDIAVTT